MIEVMGENSTAKSAFGYHAIGAFQRAGGKCILIDSEAKADSAFMERMGLDFKKLSYSQGENMEGCIQVLKRVGELADPAVPILIVWDSIASTPGAAELDKYVADKEFKGDVGARARQLSASLRATLGPLARKNVTFIAINQLRTKFNFMGMASQDATGGKAPKYHAGVRLMFKTKGMIRHKERDVITGIAVEVEAKKNACSPPFRKCQVKFYFDTGFAPYSGLDELLLRHGRISQKAGWLVYKEKTFRGGELERVIAEMPDLIDPIVGVVDTPTGDDISSGNGQADTKANAEEAAETAEE